MATKRNTDSRKSQVLENPEVVGDLDTSSGHLAGELPESLTFTVEMPAPVHEAPVDELAVAIDDTQVDPGYLDSARPNTRSIDVIPEAVVLKDAAEETVIPELPPSDSVYSRRSRQRGQVSESPEPSGMLTAERLLERHGTRHNPPEGAWRAFVYAATLHLVNLGDSWRVRERKSIDARIDKVFDGGTRFVPVLTRKGGVGKTTITALIGMAMADVREDRVIAVDANPDRGTLAERVSKQTRATVRDVVTRGPAITTFSEFSTLVSRDETRLDVLASDPDPMLSDAFDEDDYNVVADMAARFYSVMLTDCGTGIVHSVMRATLQRADAIIIVSGGSVDEARLASETLTWLEANGYGHLVSNAVVALNTATQGTNLVKIEEIEAHFQSRVRDIVRIPYDPLLATGSVINYRDLRPITKEAARLLAALVVDGLPARRTDPAA